MIRRFLQRKIVQDSVLYAVANGVVQVCSLVGVLFVSRYLGPTNLGLYSFVQNYIAGFMTVFAGIDMYANWYIVKSANSSRALVHYIRQKIVITIPLILLLILVSFFFLPKDVLIFLPFLLVPIITSIFSSSVFVLQYQNKTKLIAIGMIVSALLILILKVVAVSLKQSLLVFVAINSIDGMLLTFLCCYYIFFYTKKNSPSIVNAENKKQSLGLRTLLFSSGYSIVYICFWYIVTRADQFVIPAYFNAYSLGIYGAAVKVIEMTNVLIVILQGIVLPRMAFIQAETGTTKRMHMTLGLYVAVGFAAALSIQIFAPLAVSILFGPAFVETVDILRVYAWSIPGLFVSYLFTVVAMANSTVKTLAVQSVCIAILTVCSLLFALTFNNIYAIAWVSVIMYSISAISLYILWKKKTI